MTLCVCGHEGSDHVDDGMSTPCGICWCDHLQEPEGGYGPMGTSANPDE